MTRFPLRSLKLRSGEEFQDTLPVELERYELGGATYLPVPGTVDAELRIQRASSGDVFRLRLAARIHGPCVRCLDDAVVPIEIDAREYQAVRPDGDENLVSEYVVDDHLELSAWARDAIALELPDRILCRPDCAGLCPECGANMSENPHEHAHESDAPLSPWAALEQLRDAPS